MMENAKILVQFCCLNPNGFTQHIPQMSESETALFIRDQQANVQKAYLTPIHTPKKVLKNVYFMLNLFNTSVVLS